MQAIPPHIPYQIEPTAWMACPGQKADTKPMGTARLPKVPTTIPMPVNRASATTWAMPGLLTSPSSNSQTFSWLSS